jgi:chromosome partitioning protein
MMRTIAVMNQKGGCGKTTIAINLAGAFSKLGKDVLLVDIDPQAHASVGLGIDSDKLDVTSYELVMDPSVSAARSVVKLSDHLSVIPASTVLAGVEQELAGTDGRERRLAEKLAEIDDGTFDIAVVDCPPSVGLLTFNALTASGEVLIPVDASFFSLHGLVKLRETLEVIEEELQHLVRVHVVCNNFDTRTRFSKELLDEVDRFHSGVLMETYISHTVRLKECNARGVSVFELPDASRARDQFLSLARELVKKAPKIGRQRRVVLASGPARGGGERDRRVYELVEERDPARKGSRRRNLEGRDRHQAGRVRVPVRGGRGVDPGSGEQEIRAQRVRSGELGASRVSRAWGSARPESGAEGLPQTANEREDA